MFALLSLSLPILLLFLSPPLFSPAFPPGELHSTRSTNKCPYNATNATSSSTNAMLDSSPSPDYEIFQAEVAKHSLTRAQKDSTGDGDDDDDDDDDDDKNSHYSHDASMDNYVCNSCIGTYCTAHCYNCAFPSSLTTVCLHFTQGKHQIYAPSIMTAFD